MLRLSFSLLLLLVLNAAVAQNRVTVDDEGDTVAVRQRVKVPDSLKEKVRFRAIRFGTDVLALALSGNKQYRGWEINADADMGRFYLAGDYGFAQRDETLATGGDYHTKGNYWRVGVDLNLLKKDPDRNMLFFGLRYARASSQEILNYTAFDPLFGNVAFTSMNPTVTGSWGELVAGLRVKIWKEFWMGFTSRLKVGLSVKGATDLSVYYVPGYGVVGTGATWGFNYQLFWRIPFERQKKPVRIPGQP